MTNPLTTSLQIVPSAPLHELWNIAHSRPWSLLVSNYFWLLGVAGGLTLIWAIYVIAGRRRGIEYHLAMPVSVAIMFVALMNVLGSVEQPSRLIYGYIFGWQYWDTSIIKYGIILLPLYLVMCWWLTFQTMDRQTMNTSFARMNPKLHPIADFFSLWSRHYSVLDSRRSRVWTVGVVIFMSLFVLTYSGIFMMNEHGVAIWNSPAQVLLFFTSGISESALIMFVEFPALMWLATEQRTQPLASAFLRWTAIATIGFSAIIWFGWLWWSGRFGTIEELRSAGFFMGPYASTVFWNWTFAGILLPLVLLITPLARQHWAQRLAALGILWGSYTLRLLFMVGGQAQSRSGASYQTFAPSHEAVLYTVFSVPMLFGVLAVMLLIYSVGHTTEQTSAQLSAERPKGA